MTSDKMGFSDVGDLVGETVGSYRITDLIGQGGMGVVYRAEHVLLGKRAAVKVLLPERSRNREIVDRFFNEAKASTTIEDPGIVDIFDFGRMADGNAFIVMELLEGETLGERLKRLGLLPPGQAASIASHIAGTLAAAHAHGIIHRDLKPDNVFLVRDSALPRGERAKLLDFGIAKLAGGSQPSELVKTETGRLMGTPYYMSPEQCRGAGKIDNRTDIYSLGCVLYQMLTGRPPFVLEGAGEILAAHIHVPPLPLRMHEASVPHALEVVVLRMLEKDPARRPQSAAEVVEELSRAVVRFSGEQEVPEPRFVDPDGQRPRASKSSPSVGMLTEATTLNSTAGDLARGTGVGRTARRIVRLWPWAVGAGAAATAGALLTMLVAGGDDRPAAARKPTEAGARPTPPVKPQPAPPPPPASAPVQDPIVRGLEAAAEEETVRLMVNSQPAGATVYRESDGVRLGKTPLEVRARRGRGEAVFILRRPGYRSEQLTIPVNQDQETVVVLRPRGSSAPSSAASRSLRRPAGATPPPAPPAAAAAPAPEPAPAAEGTPAEGAASAPEGAPAEEDTTAQEDTPAPDVTPLPGSAEAGKGEDEEGKADKGKDAKASARDKRKDKGKDEPSKSRGKDDALDPFDRRKPGRKDGKKAGDKNADDGAKARGGVEDENEGPSDATDAGAE